MRQRTVVVDSARDLQALSPYMTRTLRSEVDEHRPTRDVATRIVTFSTEEEAFYNAVYRICLERAVAQGVPPGFATQMPVNMTQNELALLLGISSGHLSRLINGRRCPSPSMRRRLMDVLDCSEFDELFVVVSCDE